MKAGDMDREIVIERVTESVGSSSETVQSWASLGTFWAQKIPLHGDEAFKLDIGRQVTSEVAKWKIRYADVTAKDRISAEGKLWDILHIEEVGRREGLFLLAQVQA